MSKLGAYFVRFRTMPNDLTGLPPWARAVFLLVVLPGILLVALSIMALAASVAALLFLAIPVYAVLKALTGKGRSDGMGLVQSGAWPNQTKHVDAVIRDADKNVPDEVNGE